ncbi:ATP-binding cassette domain-containing protein [Emticicia sp. CRIBPO]|uniref:ABC transporter ATP-binding protein n=1 Tax=Emticicia sp. CRIBPO TaxID=2683258 RepID=UPI001411C15A|nr:ABC transporter ATP-binding protein [Emticicia sp. CRIBPO]NBA87239.1 ATP-binding cassette domain-containing protein [Emticicia sp. CRIBPO]
MNFWQVIQRLRPYVKPNNKLVALTLLLTLIGSLAAQVNPVVLRYTVDSVQTMLNEGKGLKDGISLLFMISAILFGKEIINSLIQFGQKFYGEKIRINVSSELAQNAIQRILSYRLAFFTDNENQTGKLQTRIDRGVESLTKLIQNIFIDIFPLFANAIVALIFMFSANVYVGLVAVTILPVYFWISIVQANKLKGVRINLRRQREQKNSGLVNIIDAIVVIKSFVREQYEEIKQYGLQQSLVRLQLKTRQSNFLFDGLKSFVEQIGVVLIIILTIYLVLDQKMSIGAIMFHIMLFSNVSAPIKQLHRIYDEFNEALVYSEGFFQVLDAEDEKELSGHYHPENIAGDFVVRNVNFTYPNGMKALHDISMVIRKNKTTALVGVSGAGKSTLVQLLTKFYLPDSGEILLDGVNIQDYDTDVLRSDIGMVLQKNHIFKGTIEENIRYGEMKATFEEVEEAAKKAYLHDQIMELPKKYESDAHTLSGGQQQRIAIARLFLKNPPIIILDEPTASLDVIATEQIRISLDAIKANRTVIVISHSLSQIIDSDEIYVLQKGRLAEHGTHETLYADEGVYREIFDASARSMNLEKIVRTMESQQTPVKEKSSPEQISDEDF